MVYLTRKTTRGQHYFYLVKSFKYDGRVEKVQRYLGSEEPDEFELERLKQQHTNELELAAIERMAHMSSETYRTPYLDKEALLGLERMKFLNRAIHRLQTTDEKVKEHARNRVATIYGNMALSSNPLTFENIESIVLCKFLMAVADQKTLLQQYHWQKNKVHSDDLIFLLTRVPILQLVEQRL